MVRAGGWQGVRPLRRVGGENRASEGQINNGWPAYQRHREVSVNPGGVKEGVAEIRGSVEVGD